MAATKLQPGYPILMVDDESHALTSYELTLCSAGFENIIQCTRSTEVREILNNNKIELVLLDILMPGLSGEQLLAEIVERHPEVPVIMVTALNEVETAVRCMRNGAFDYILKPVENERLISSVRKAIDMRQLRRENVTLAKHILAETLEHPEAFSHIITQNAKMKAIFKYCEAVSRGGHPILVTGETGVGKELIAEAIHKSRLESHKMLAVNAAGLDDIVFSDTLFGHIKGAFTGAANIRRGYIEKAAGGSLFLDEIGDLSTASQVKLLRLLDTHEYYPLGSDMPKFADVFFIFATHRDLPALVEQNLFRKDLYFRLHTHHIHIPPLRERLDDLPMLLEHFIHQAAREFNKPPPSFGPGHIELISDYSFPGNIRELQSMVYDAVGSSDSKNLPIAFFSDAFHRKGRANSPIAPKFKPKVLPLDPGRLAQMERLPSLKELNAFAIAEAMRRTGNNQRQAAKILGISPQALHQRLKKMNVL